ncbi:MAG TPA: trypsin-like serine protease [Gemmatimonadaceae bacterium]|nr:trypsin-like serine protease [Gemmatimonadaceae bacterium]
MRTRLSVAAIWCLLCHVAALTAVINGTNQDPTDAPAVGFLKTDNSDCTVTLIGDRVIITAAHCIDGVPTKGTVLLDSRHVRASLYSSPLYSHAAFTKGAPPNQLDIAVGILDEVIASVTPATIGGLTSVGDMVTFFGYGESSRDMSGAGQFRKGINRITYAREDGRLMRIGPLKSNPALDNPADVGSLAAPGDSGGPVFATDQNGRVRLLGVMSKGASREFSSWQEPFTIAVRLDNPDSRAFLLSIATKHKLSICGISIECPEIVLR